MEINVQQCCEILREMDDIVILCHRNPDGDTLGAGFALHYILAQLGKRSRVECHDVITPMFSYLLLDYKPEEFEPKNIVAVDIADEKLELFAIIYPFYLPKYALIASAMTSSLSFFTTLQPLDV